MNGLGNLRHSGAGAQVQVLHSGYITPTSASPQNARHGYTELAQSSVSIGFAKRAWEPEQYKCHQSVSIRLNSRAETEDGEDVTVQRQPHKEPRHLPP
jgi:hypothetical protein